MKRKIKTEHPKKGMGGSMNTESGELVTMGQWSTTRRNKNQLFSLDNAACNSSTSQC